MDDLKRTGYPMTRLLKLYGIQRSTFYGWSEEQTASPLTRRNVLAILPEQEKAVVNSGYTPI